MDITDIVFNEYNNGNFVFLNKDKCIITLKLNINNKYNYKEHNYEIIEYNSELEKYELILKIEKWDDYIICFNGIFTFNIYDDNNILWDKLVKIIQINFKKYIEI